MADKIKRIQKNKKRLKKWQRKMMGKFRYSRRPKWVEYFKESINQSDLETTY